MAPIEILMIPLLVIARIIPIAVISLLLRKILSISSPTAIQFVVFNFTSYILGIVLAGYGHADGGEPKFALAAQEYLLPSLLLTIYNLVRISRASLSSSKQASLPENVAIADEKNLHAKRIFKILILWILGLISTFGILINVNDYTPNYVAALIFLLVGLPSFVRGYRLVWRSLMS